MMEKNTKVIFYGPSDSLTEVFFDLVNGISPFNIRDMFYSFILGCYLNKDDAYKQVRIAVNSALSSIATSFSRKETKENTFSFKDGNENRKLLQVAIASRLGHLNYTKGLIIAEMAICEVENFLTNGLEIVYYEKNRQKTGRFFLDSGDLVLSFN